jgi:hypothetical protein
VLERAHQAQIDHAQLLRQCVGVAVAVQVHGDAPLARIVAVMTACASTRTPQQQQHSQ